MQSTSTTYKLIVAGEYEVEMKANIAGVDYNEDYIVSCSTSLDVLSSSDSLPTVGDAVAAQLDLVLIDVDMASLPKMAEIKLYYRVTNGILTSEWIQKGVFFIDTRSIDSDDQLTIHGYDPMLKADVAMISAQGEQGNWPKTDIQVVTDIANRIGVTIDPRTTSIITHAYTIDYPGYADEGYSMRDVLGYIAGMYGCFAIISDEGKLLFKKIEKVTSPSTVAITEYQDHQLYSKTAPFYGVEGNTGKSALTSEMAIKKTVVSSTSPTMSVRGKATVTRASIGTKVVTATTDLKFSIDSTSSYTTYNWKMQLVWSNLKDNKSELVTINEKGNRWQGKSSVSVSCSVEGQQWTSPNDRTLKIDIYKDNLDEWESDTHYDKNDIVIYSNKYYKARKTHTSDSSFKDADWKEILYSAAAERVNRIEVVFLGSMMPRYDNTVDTENSVLTYTNSTIPNWAIDTTYQIGDKVRRDGKNYNCIHGHTSDIVFEDEYWTEIEASVILEFDCPWTTQEVVDNLKNQILNYEYQPYELNEVICDPAIEVGDYISIGNTGIIGTVFNRSITFGRLTTMSLSAPSDSNVTHEYQFNKTATEELLKNVIKQLQTRFTVQEGLIESFISGTVTMYHTSSDPSTSQDLQAGDIWYNGSSWKRWTGSTWEDTAPRPPADWKGNTQYYEGDYVTHGNNWYRCNDTHISPENWSTTKWDLVTVIEYDASSAIRQELDKITLSVTYDTSENNATLTLGYGNITLDAKTIDIIGRLRLQGNVYRKYDTSARGDEEDPYGYLIGVNTYHKTGDPTDYHRLQIGSAKDGNDFYDSMSIYGSGPIYLMADPSDTSRKMANVTINNDGIKIDALKGSSGTSADNHLLTIDTTTGQIKVCDKTRNNIGSGEAVFG